MHSAQRALPTRCVVLAGAKAARMLPDTLIKDADAFAQAIIDSARK